MIKYIGFIAFIISACQSQESIPTLSGEWKISFTAYDESRYGKVIFNDDHTGNLFIEYNPESLLINGEDEFNFDWNISGDQLILQRRDNDFLLDYKLQIISEDQISLLYSNDIQVLLIR